MNEKSYNMYLRMVKLACKNVRAAICQENGITEKDQVQVKVRDRDSLVNIVAAIMQSPDSAETIYASRVEKRLVIVTDMKLLHAVDTTIVFIESILKSRSARICQKQLINYLMAERYLDAAWDYDKQHVLQKKALVAAREVITQKYSLNFLGGFIFDERPHIEPHILVGLKSQAFDARYSLVTEEQNNKMVDRKYAVDLGARDDVFLSSSPVSFSVNTIKSTQDTSQKSMIDVFINRSKKSETDIISQLHTASFADMPLHKRRRKFVNLKAKNCDVELTPEKSLSIKRQFSQIEATTKHTYIMNYFNDHIGSTDDRQLYYFDQEAWMYKYIWQIEGNIYSQTGNLYLPDDKVFSIPNSMTDYEFFHRVNTVYAALFGFTDNDVVGGNNWLIDSIRKAYTDEGNALYRLSIIDRRLHTITREGEQKKW